MVQAAKGNAAMMNEVMKLAETLPTELYRKVKGIPNLAFMLHKPSIGSTVKIPRKRPIYVK
jgi:hypothetical protein